MLRTSILAAVLVYIPVAACNTTSAQEPESERYGGGYGEGYGETEVEPRRQRAQPGQDPFGQGQDSIEGRRHKGSGKMSLSAPKPSAPQGTFQYVEGEEIRVLDTRNGQVYELRGDRWEPIAPPIPAAPTRGEDRTDLEYRVDRLEAVVKRLMRFMREREQGFYFLE